MCLQWRSSIQLDFRFGVASARKSLTSNLNLIGLPPAVRWSGCGDRLAAVGRGGVVAAWRLDAPQLSGLAYADWTAHALSRQALFASSALRCNSNFVKQRKLRSERNKQQHLCLQVYRQIDRQS